MVLYPHTSWSGCGFPSLIIFMILYAFIYKFQLLYFLDYQLGGYYYFCRTGMGRLLFQGATKGGGAFIPRYYRIVLNFWGAYIIFACLAGWSGNANEYFIQFLVQIVEIHQCKQNETCSVASVKPSPAVQRRLPEHLFPRHSIIQKGVTLFTRSGVRKSRDYRY